MITPFTGTDYPNLNNPGPEALRLFAEIEAAAFELRKAASFPLGSYHSCRDCGANSDGIYCYNCAVARVIIDIEDGMTHRAAQWLFLATLALVDGVAHPKPLPSIWE